MSADALTSVHDFASRYTAAWCSHDASNVARFFAPKGSLAINGSTPSVGRDAITKAAQGFMTDFPDLIVYMDDVVSGMIVPAEISIFEDRSFTFVTKTPPTAFLLKQAAGVEKGAQNARMEKVGSVTKDQVRQIAETKMPDLNAVELDDAVAQVEGTARSMGIQVSR